MYPESEDRPGGEGARGPRDPSGADGPRGPQGPQPAYVSFGGFGNLRDTGMLGERARQLIRHSWKVLLGLGIAALLAGVLLLVWPGQTTLVVAMLFGVYLVVSGIAQIAFGASINLAAAPKWLTILAGVLSVVVGILCLANGAAAIRLLGVFIGITWLFHGIARLAAIPRPGATGRGLAIVSGILSILGGIVLLVSPIGSVLALAVVSGIVLVVLGLAAILQANTLRKSLQPF